MYQSLLSLLQKRKDALGSPIGWDWVKNDPVVNLITPILHFLEKQGYLELTDALRQQSEELYWNLTAFWIRREHKMKLILQQFDKEKIDVIPLKGVALLESIYKRIGVRFMSDVDLLVHEADFVKASRILIDQGMQPKWQTNPSKLYDFEQLPNDFWPGELGFAGNDKLHIDLHRDLVTYHWFRIGFPVDISKVWGRSLDLESKGGNNTQHLIWNKMLSPYDMLAHMCLHLAFHGLGIMKNYLDVDLWLRNLPEDWDWNQYLNLVDEWKLKTVSYHVFLFSHEFFNTPIDIEVMRTMKPGMFDRWLVKLLISPDILLKNLKSLGVRYPSLVKFALIDGLSTKWDVIRNLLFPDRSWLNANPDYHNLWDHWSHLYQVFIRGD